MISQFIRNKNTKFLLHQTIFIITRFLQAAPYCTTNEFHRCINFPYKTSRIHMFSIAKSRISHADFKNPLK